MSKAFNAVIGCSVILQQLSFSIPIALIMVRKRSTTFLSPARSFRMPNILGWIVNTYAVSFITLMAVILCLPVTIPTDASTMSKCPQFPDVYVCLYPENLVNDFFRNIDYTVVILGFCFLLGLGNWWLHAKEHYNGPVMETWEGHGSEPTEVFAVAPQQKNASSEIE
jgi:choline transport protein